MSTPYAQALEQKFSALRRLQRMDLEAPLDRAGQVDGTWDQRKARGLRDAIVACLRDAEPFYWGPEFCEMMQNSAMGMPPWVLTPDTLPTPNGYFWFGRPIRVAREGGFTGAVLVTSLVWFSFGSNGVVDPDGGISLHFMFVHSGGGDTPGLHTRWDFGKTYDETFTSPNEPSFPDLADKGSIGCGRLLGACLQFIAQKILVAPSAPVDRAARKRLAALGVTEPTVRVIQLRKKAAPVAAPELSDGVEWSCRWIVSGHWHKFWVGPRDRRVLQPRWVMPYVKGPGDKPLKPQAQRLFAVVR